MSRSGYSDDLDPLELGAWRGQVASAIRGKRGQKMLTDLKDALQAMTKRELVHGELSRPDGGVCALGALGVSRGVDMSTIDPHNTEDVGRAFDIARQLAAEVVSLNDDGCVGVETETQRWWRMHAWVCSHIRRVP